MKGVVEVGLEEEVLGKLGDHEKKLSEHDVLLGNHSEKIHELELKDIGFEGRFNNLDTQMTDIKGMITRMENNHAQTSTLLLNSVNTLSAIATNNAKSSNDIAKSEAKGSKEITKIKLNNNTKVALKVLALVGAVLTGWLASKYGINIKL